MKIVTPIEVAVADTLGTGTILTAINIAEDEYSDWSAGSYDADDMVIFDHGVYKALSTTSDQPDTGAAATTPTWVRVSATNRWKMFDSIIGAQASKATSITFSLEPGELTNALGFFNLVGETLQVTVDDSGGDGVVYDEMIDLQDTSNIIDWYSYFFEEVQYLQDLVLLDLPAYPDATISVVISKPGGTAECGEAVIGRWYSVGDASFGATVGIQSYSVATEDDFGARSITPRGYKNRGGFPISLATAQVYFVKKKLTDLRDVPTVYIGDPDRPETIIYGFFRDLDMVISGPVVSDYQLDIEGLI